jgi:hypothetical protein
VSGIEQRSQLGVAISGLLYRVAVEPKRDVVQEHPPVHLGNVDPALDTISERVERADQIIPIHTDIEREVVARPRGNAHERKRMSARGRRDHRQRPIATGHAEPIRATCDGIGDQGLQPRVRIEDDRLHPSFPRPLDEADAPRLAATRPRIDEQDRPPKRFGRPPALA